MTMAPIIMGNPDRKELSAGIGQQLLPYRSGNRQAFCTYDFSFRLPQHSADADIPALILQCSSDVIAPQDRR